MSGRMLILDDDPEFTAFAVTVGKASGYEVLGITDPTVFESSLRSWSPSHVIVDLYMPAIDGLEALQILARGQSAAKIVLCSAAPREFLEAVNRLGKRLNLNMSGIIEKPVGVTQLKACLESAWGRNPLPGSLHQTFDRSFFEEMRGTMGRDWACRAVAILVANIESTFKEEMLTSDREQLARRAHALVSYAGMLGFTELSQLCRDLEEACNNIGDVSWAFHQAQVASRSVSEKAREMIVDLTQAA